MRLREVLGDSSDNPRFVETIPRRGYRFIAHVDEFFPASPAAAVREPSANQIAIVTPVAQPQSVTASPEGISQLLTQHRMVGIVGLLVILAGGVIAARYFATRNSNNALGGKQTTSLVVLPLENLSGDQEQNSLRTWPKSVPCASSPVLRQWLINTLASRCPKLLTSFTWTPWLKEPF
jgi:hypothetical protein